ncbi:hypothetical protein A9K55_006957 [Cordyceps militaris]|uniref:Uncharacterized protein n=1 Tax=Cordyceps militaris TaxID=73501 RepID=A0A2H4SHH1_CORMI|nr:hypothetical protein A9K55_006957 [Cordyceps militaris]
MVRFTGGLLGFTLARLAFLDVAGTFCAPLDKITPLLSTVLGECYHYQRGRPGFMGIRLHLFCVLPAALLVCFQFVPVIRHCVILAYRLNGYAILLLQGGEPETHAYVCLPGIMFLFALAMAVTRIRQKRVMLHLAWMLRAWFYAGSIITLRLILLLGISIMVMLGGYWTTRACAQIDFTFAGDRNTTLSYYLDCEAWYDGAEPDKRVVVPVGTADLVQMAAALGVFFGTAGMLALFLYGVEVESYISSTTPVSTVTAVEKESDGSSPEHKRNSGLA